MNNQEGSNKNYHSGLKLQEFYLIYLR